MNTDSIKNWIKTEKEHQEQIDGLKNILGIDKINEIVKQNQKSLESISKL